MIPVCWWKSMRNIQLIKGMRKLGGAAVMRIKREDVVKKMKAYFGHQISLIELVDWAEQAMMDGDFVGKDWKTVRDVVARIGVADVRAFGLAWEDCEQTLMELGYRTEVQIFQTSSLN